MVLSEATSLYTNIPIVDALNIIKNYVNNYDEFTGGSIYYITKRVS